jgi:5-methylthioadenosine/S-adenosylhomocysteine deaminase
MRTVGELARAGNIQINMHVLESRTQWQSAQQQYAQSYVEVLERNGLLCPQLTMNHAIWLTASDIARMGANGVSTTHNPMSNFKLSSGVSPVRQLLAAGVNVALGSDGPATGDSSDFMQTIRFAALIHKLEPQRGLAPPSAAAIVQMASLAGARSMGTGGSCGELRPGAQADLTLLDARNPGLVPLNHAARQLAYSVGSDAVHTVLVAGDPVFQAGRFTRIDEVAVSAEIREEAERFRRMVLAARHGAQPAMLAFIRKVVAHAHRQATVTGTVNRPLAG